MMTLLGGCGSSPSNLDGSDGNGLTGGGAGGGSAGSGAAGGRAGSGVAGSGVAGSGVAGSGVAGSGVSGGSTLVGCSLYPSTNPWNQDISGAALNARNATYLAQMNPTTHLHPDWGTITDGYGIPFSSGTGATPQPMTWTTSWGSSESDKLACPTGTNKFCYPIPLSAPIEGGPNSAQTSDRHVLYVDTAGAPDNCTLYELYQALNPTESAGSSGSAGWKAANGAIFPLGSNALRPEGWTSADAAGLPILPGLVRLDEVLAGAIKHAIRFTMANTSNGHIHPATHQAGQDNPALPPMGLRLRLKASFDLSGYSGPALVILTAMKRYGLILADNGSDWFITGDSNNGWSPYQDAINAALSKVHGSDFEAVDTGPVLTTVL